MPRVNTYSSQSVLCTQRILVAIIITLAGLSTSNVFAQKVSNGIATANESRSVTCKSNKFRIDLVPQKAFAVIAVRVADILAQDSMKLVREFIGHDKDKLIKFAGLEPTNIATITFIYIFPGKQHASSTISLAVVVHAEKVIDRQAASKLLPTKTAETIHRGISFLKSQDDSSTKSLLFLDDRTMVIADNEQIMKEVINAKQSSGSFSLLKQWKVIENKSIAAICDMRAVRSLIGDTQATHNIIINTIPILRDATPIWKNTEVVSLVVTVDKLVSMTTMLYQEKGPHDVKDSLEAIVKSSREALQKLKINEISRNKQEQILIKSLVSFAKKVLEASEVTLQGKEVIFTSVMPVEFGTRMVEHLAPVLLALREVKHRNVAMDNLKRISVAFHDYHKEHNHFPPAIVLGPDGKTPHSWRVELLPYLDQKSLHQEYKMNEPWNSNHNKKVLAKIPAVFRNPNDNGMIINTSYFAVVGKNTAFGNKNGVKLSDITDGAKNTILIVETKLNVPWSKPEDIIYDGNKNLIFGGFHPGYFHILLCNGLVEAFSNNISKEGLQYLLEINDGESDNLF